MNKTNIHTPTPTHLAEVRVEAPIRQFDVKASRRMLVLVPANFNHTTVTQRIWELAQATGSTVQLLGLCNDAEQEMSLRRELITMSALIRGAGISVSMTVEAGTDWVDGVKHSYRSGDMIVCMAGQRTGLLRRPLSELLESTLQSPIYILSEIHASKPQSLSNKYSQVLAWAGSLAIIAGFFLLQIKIYQPANHWSTIMELLSTGVEIWLIMAWNGLFE